MTKESSAGDSSKKELDIGLGQVVVVRILQLFDKRAAINANRKINWKSNRKTTKVTSLKTLLNLESILETRYPYNYIK